MADEFERIIQQTVEDELNPVRFGRTQRVILWAILALTFLSAAASLLTLVLTV